ncbi:fibropellin-1-like isoform X2 [Patiria miniata]|uniref:EGF-like domain-containing protein n=1 Tax=Patiria miniata TaxID=46514 RepID=A0A914BFT2_PATMI|nr:fibropellin-1-like isoform X2 [Patiria miniata]
MMLLGTFAAGTLALLAGLAVDISTASPHDHGHGDDYSYECANPEVCQNGGTCLFQVFDITFCACPETHAGIHCENDNHCHSDPCQNGGICDYDYTTNGYYCVCREGWTGQNCQTASGTTSCADIDCEHGGTCYHHAGFFFCLCRTRYYGYLCEAIDDHTCNAVTAPCANGGTCVDDSNGRGYCYCTDEWAGDNCTEPFPVASLCDHFCENAGSCYITEGREPACRCAPGWIGEHCSDPFSSSPDTPDICGTAWDPCGHNGRCTPDTVSELGFVCVCSTGWEGDLCQDPIGVVPHPPDFPAPCDAHPNPCSFNGRCVPDADFGGFSCRCDPGWQGEFCQDRSPDPPPADNEAQSSGLPIGGIVGASVGSLVLFFVIFGAVFILNIAKAGKMRRSRPPPPAPAPIPSVIYDPGVHADFHGSVHGVAEPWAKDVHGSDRYQQTRIPRRYTPTPIRDHHSRPSNLVRNPGAGTYDYAYAPGPPSYKVRMASSPPRAPPLMPMPGVERGHEYEYAIDNAAYEPSPRNPSAYAASPKSTMPAVVGPPPAYTPSRAPSKARSEHTYQSISEYAHPPSSPRSEAGPAPSVKSVGSHHSSKK